MAAGWSWTVHSPDHRTHARGSKLLPRGRAALRRALAGAGLETRYQPIVDITTDQVFAWEALARLTLANDITSAPTPLSPITLSPITLSPGDFLPQVEECGLGGALANAVAERAFADWAAWPGTTDRPLLSINLSLDVMLSAAAFIRLETRRIAAGLPSHAILIELTESRPADDLPRLHRALERIRKAGYAVALDDITPSLPHLENLLEMPFTELKLDRAVVQAAAYWPDAAAFIARIVDRAQPSSARVVAEGVEDVATLDRVRGLGIQHVQGFLSGRPMRAAHIQPWQAARA